MEQAYLSIHKISKAFGSCAVLNDISFTVGQGEFVCLLGPSGCGKTTLLRIIAGLEEANSGTILLSGREITHLPPAKRNFGIVFQSYALFPNITAYENIAYGLKSKKMPRKEMDEKVKEILRLVGLEHVKNHYPAQLSGGQQQRVALARALALSPDFLLLDEPLSALDAKVRVKLRSEIRNLQEKLKITTIMVTHDQEEALCMSDRIIVMNNATLEQIGTPREVYERPNSPFVADFIGSINFFAADNFPQYGDQNKKLMAIRPEHIRIVEGVSQDALPAFVKDVEFRGAFCRVTLRIDENLKDNPDLVVDVPSYTIKKLKIEKNMSLSVEIPGDRMISYDKHPREIIQKLDAAG
ncbi:MAG: putative 2-aminoethylphosphonate ABC transporter ATP-binding protein [Bacillota bacterium]